MRNSQNFVSQPARWKGATETEQQKVYSKTDLLRQSRAHYPHHACYYRTTVRLKWLKNKNLWYGDQSQSSLQSQGHPSTGFVTVHVLCFLCSYPFPSLIKMHFVGIVKLSVFEGIHPTLFREFPCSTYASENLRNRETQMLILDTMRKFANMQLGYVNTH